MDALIIHDWIMGHLNLLCVTEILSVFTYVVRVGWLKQIFLIISVLISLNRCIKCFYIYEWLWNEFFGCHSTSSGWCRSFTNIVLTLRWFRRSMETILSADLTLILGSLINILDNWSVNWVVVASLRFVLDSTAAHLLWLNLLCVHIVLF
jgi:hypothetical protein